MLRDNIRIENVCSSMCSWTFHGLDGQGIKQYDRPCDRRPDGSVSEVKKNSQRPHPLLDVRATSARNGIVAPKVRMSGLRSGQAES